MALNDGITAGLAPRIFDRALIARRRDRAAQSIGEHDFLLRRVAEDFAERLSIVRREFSVALNLGAHHGVISRVIRQLPSVGLTIDAEFSPVLARQCDGPTVVADEEYVPFADTSLDLVVSGLSLQHVNDLPGVFAQIRRALKPDGLFLAALFGGETLHELREAFIAAEIETSAGASPRVAPFADVRSLGGLLQRAGFTLPVADTDTVCVRYDTALHLMHDLRAMGLANALTERSRQPLRRETLHRAAAIYAERFGSADGRITATFEIITLTAWTPHPDQPKPLRPGSAQVSLKDVLKPPT